MFGVVADEPLDEFLEVFDQIIGPLRPPEG